MILLVSNQSQICLSISFQHQISRYIIHEQFCVEDKGRGIKELLGSYRTTPNIRLNVWVGRILSMVPPRSLKRRHVKHKVRSCSRHPDKCWKRGTQVCTYLYPGGQLFPLRLGARGIQPTSHFLPQFLRQFLPTRQSIYAHIRSDPHIPTTSSLGIVDESCLGDYKEESCPLETIAFPE